MQIESAVSPARSLAGLTLLVQRDQDGRTGLVIRDSPRDDADHANMPFGM
jgi:hypothetical protein